MINPVPIQDAARLQSADGVKVIQGIEARVIMLGFPHGADKLKYSADAGKPNPFRDARVRMAVAHAVNVDAILQKIIGVVFNEAMQRVVRAFEARAKALYGPQG